MKRMIKEYQQETDFVNAGAGTATWCIATKGGKKYFVKSFLEVTLVDEETAKIFLHQWWKPSAKAVFNFVFAKSGYITD